jgi:hypothetical protein
MNKFNFSKRSVILLHSVLCTAFNLTANAQNSELHNPGHTLDTLVISEKPLEFNEELRNIIAKECESLQEETKFYNITYTSGDTLDQHIEKFQGTFFLTFRPKKLLPILEDSSAFISTNYFPDSISATISNHLGVMEIFWDNILYKRQNKIVSKLEDADGVKSHTIKISVSDSFRIYKTFFYSYSDSVSLITKVNSETGAINEVTVLNPSNAFKLYVRHVPYGSYVAHYFYANDGSPDAIEVKYEYEKDHLIYYENYSIKAIEFKGSLTPKDLTKENRNLLYKLQHGHGKLGNILKLDPSK